MKSILDQAFHQSLDLQHYIPIINGNMTSIIIIIEDYEVIAILTYERPEHCRFIYLDKFAVLLLLK